MINNRNTIDISKTEPEARKLKGKGKYYKFETVKFDIRFIEEEIEANQIVNFIHEVDIPRHEDQDIMRLRVPLMLKAVLYHNKLSDKNQK